MREPFSSPDYTWNLDCMTQALLLDEKTAPVVIPYVRALQIFLQTEALPPNYKTLPLRKLLSYMQLSREEMDTLDASLRAISEKKEGK